MYICICIYIDIYICICIDIYMYTNMYKYIYIYISAQGWSNRSLIGHEPLICSKMCFTKTELVQ